MEATKPFVVKQKDGSYRTIKAGDTVPKEVQESATRAGLTQDSAIPAAQPERPTVEEKRGRKG